jgi:hypothetical protein
MCEVCGAPRGLYSWLLFFVLCVGGGGGCGCAVIGDVQSEEPQATNRDDSHGP